MLGRRAQGDLPILDSILSLLAQRDSSEFLLTCQTPGCGSFARRKTGVGGSQTAWRAWLCLVYCPAPRFLHDGQHHPEHWLSLPPVLLPRPWHLLQVPYEDQEQSVALPTPLCPAPAVPWETSMLCHTSHPGMGHIPLSLHGTTAGNKGLSSALVPQCPGSAPWRVGVCGWHREGGIHPRVKHHPRPGSLHPVPTQIITQDTRDDADTTYPIVQDRGG